MLETYSKFRWYDRNPKVKQVFGIVESMSTAEKESFAQDLLKVINLLREDQNIKDLSVSLGGDKIFSYYKAYNKRRWYDQIPGLMRAFNLLSILSNEERDIIADGILSSFGARQIEVSH